MRSSVRATGTVVDLQRDSEGDTTPIVEYTNADGAKVTFEPPVSAANKYGVDDDVKVRYDPAEPEKARIDYWGSWWINPAMWVGAAVVFAGAASFIE